MKAKEETPVGNKEDVEKSKSKNAAIDMADVERRDTNIGDINNSI